MKISQSWPQCQPLQSMRNSSNLVQIDARTHRINNEGNINTIKSDFDNPGVSGGVMIQSASDLGFACFDFITLSVSQKYFDIFCRQIGLSGVQIDTTAKTFSCNLIGWYDM